MRLAVETYIPCNVSEVRNMVTASTNCTCGGQESTTTKLVRSLRIASTVQVMTRRFLKTARSGGINWRSQ